MADAVGVPLPTDRSLLAVHASVHVASPGDLLACRFSRTGSSVATAVSDGSIHVHTVSAKPKHTQTLQPTASATAAAGSDGADPGLRMPATCLRFVSAAAAGGTDNVLLATYASGYVRRWHVTSSTCLSEIKAPDILTALDTHPSNSQFAMAGQQGIVRVYDGATSQCIHSLGPGLDQLAFEGAGRPLGHGNRVFAVKYDRAEGHILASGGWDNTVLIWDTRTPASPVKHVSGPFVGGDALDLDTAQGDLLAGSYRQTDSLQVFDLKAGKLRKTLSSELEPCWVYCCQYSSNPRVLAACGSKANEVRLIDRVTGNTIGRVESACALYSLDFSPSGRFLAACGADGQQHILKISLPSVK